MWNEDIQAELQLSLKNGAAQALARESCLLAEFAERESHRLAELHRKKSTSETLYDKALTSALANQTACEAAKIGVEVSRAKSMTIQALLDRTILRAPFAGIVAEVNGEIGEFITPSPTGVATLPAIDLINLQDLYVTAPVDEMDAARIKADMQVQIALMPTRISSSRARFFVLLPMSWNWPSRHGQLRWNALSARMTDRKIYWPVCRKRSPGTFLFDYRNFGLGERRHHRPEEFSGGQRQLVAIGRAIINEPEVVLADQPTGNLDGQSGRDIVFLFEKLNRQGLTLIVVTHDPEIGGRAGRQIHFTDGRIVEGIRGGGRGWKCVSQISFPLPGFPLSPVGCAAS